MYIPVSRSGRGTNLLFPPLANWENHTPHWLKPLFTLKWRSRTTLWAFGKGITFVTTASCESGSLFSFSFSFESFSSEEVVKSLRFTFHASHDRWLGDKVGFHTSLILSSNSTVPHPRLELFVDEIVRWQSQKHARCCPWSNEFNIRREPRRTFLIIASINIFFKLPSMTNCISMSELHVKCGEKSL